MFIVLSVLRLVEWHCRPAAPVSGSMVLPFPLLHVVAWSHRPSPPTPFTPCVTTTSICMWRAVLSGVRGPQFLSLLVKSMKGDASIKRVAAFSKRLLQVRLKERGGRLYCHIM